ncbi:MAG: hypothetical protein U5M23_00470 [Marinagarivorans sp.]|nr:hypothetical protein [Marinagarivorans sp.]
MPNYRRAKIIGSTWFFTVNLLERHNNALLIENISLLKACIKKVYHVYPFEIIAWVFLLDHMHCLWKLPEGDADYATRWRLIKSHFSKALPLKEYRSPVRIKTVSAAFGRGITGSIGFVTSMIFNSILIIFIAIR